MINIHSNLNEVIILSFNGNISEAIKITDYGWLLFYPCIYVFAIWDACRDAGGANDRFLFLPFVIASYLGTVGVIYSSNLKIDGFYLGPIFLPLLFIFLGFGVGMLIRIFILKNSSLQDK